MNIIQNTAEQKNLITSIGGQPNMAINNIPLIKLDKRVPVVRKEKFVRYRIANFKKGKPTGAIRSGTSLFCCDKGNSLVLIKLSYQPSFDKTKKFSGGAPTAYSIKIKNGHIVIWRVYSSYGSFEGKPVRTVRNTSNNIEHLKKEFFRFGVKNTYAPNPAPKPINEPKRTLQPGDFELRSSDFDVDCTEKIITKTEERTLKIVERRFNTLLIAFLKRNNINFKYSKNPFENLRIAAYPNSADISLENQSISSLYSRHFLHGDIKYVIKQCFGYSTDKIVKMVCERIQKDKNCEILGLGVLLKKLIPLDYYYELINIDKRKIKNITMLSLRPDKLFKTARQFLKNYNSARILKLIEDSDFDTFYFTDTIYMYLQIKNIEGFIIPEKPKGWKDIHDNFTQFQRRIKDKLNSFELPIPENYKEINNAVIEDFRLEVPAHTDVLAKYSDILSNCIRSYGFSVKNGNTRLLAVYKKDELLYNISIVNKQIQQFLGKYNAAADENDKIKVIKFLEEKKIINKSQDGTRENPYILNPVNPNQLLNVIPAQELEVVVNP